MDLPSYLPIFGLACFNSVKIDANSLDLYDFILMKYIYACLYQHLRIT